METQDVIFILEAKIQRQRIKDMREAAKKREIQTTDKFSLAVTHLVTEFKDIDALGSILRKLNINIDELIDVNIVSVEWFTDCMKAGKVVQVQDKHRIQSRVPETPQTQEVPPENVYHMPEYACQRATPLNHFNKTLTDALEVLELHAELRDGPADYSRALAFRRASCVLKCLPFRLTSVQQLRKVTNIGDHSRRVIQECLEDGSCTEVEDIRNDPWFQKMKLFSGIFGIGSSKAKGFIEKGWSSISEAQEGFSSSDTRVQWGLAFHEELTMPVCRREAEFILSEVKHHVKRLLPGAILELTGGFRRGKPAGHDVDILITHPQMGKEIGLLPRLLHSLQSHDMTLCGRYEKCTYSDAVLKQDSKLSMKGQLDHHEKWLGIVKVPKLVETLSRVTATVCHNSLTQSPNAGMIPTNTETSASVTENFEKNEEIVITESDSIVTNTETMGTNTVPNAETKVNATDPIASYIGTNSDSANNTTCEYKDLKTVEADTKRNSDDGDDDEGDDDYDRNLDYKGESLTKQDKLDRTNIIKLSKAHRGWMARRVDLIVAPYDQYFYALVGWTGNKMFNRDLRLYATREVGMKLTSHGLYDLTKGRKVPASSEREVFEHLQIPYRDPCDRNC